MVLTTGVLAAAGSSEASEAGVAQSAAPQPPVLLPRDEAADDAAFLAFRRDLLAKLRAGEFAAVADMAHPNIKLSFGGSSGRETLHRWLIENPTSDGASLRQELERAITLGGVFLGLSGEGGAAPLEGYVTAPDFRSPIDYRAVFKRQSDDSWLMTLFIAGD